MNSDCATPRLDSRQHQARSDDYITAISIGADYDEGSRVGQARSKFARRF